MPLPSFTVTGTLLDLLGNVAGGEIVGNGLGGATPATVKFVSNVPANAFVTWAGDLYHLNEVVATVNSAGEILRNGEPVKLLANDPGLSVDGLQWQVHAGPTARFWFDAPADGATVDLGSVAPVPGVSVEGLVSIPVSGISGATDFAKGFLTDVDNAAEARTLIGVDLIGLDELEWFANFAAFPGSGQTTDKVYGDRSNGKMYRWSGSAYVPGTAQVAAADITDSTSTGRALVVAADAAAARTAITAQAADTDLTAIAALTSAANKLPYATGAGAWALADFTAAGRALVDDADVAAQRATLGAQELVYQASGAVANGSTDDRAALAAADTAAVAAGRLILLKTGTHRIASTLTLAAPVRFEPGAIIKPDSGVTVTLSGGVTAPLAQICDHTAGGLVVPKKADFYHPAWWGPVGTANDSAAWTAMAAAITASVSTVLGVNFGQKVLAPAGINRIIGVTVSSCAIHAGLGGSVFVPPDGTTSGTVLALGNYAQLHGGSFATTESGQAVTLLHLTGQRAQADGIYAFNQAANSTAVKLGNGSGTISPVLTNVRLISGLTTPAAGSIGIDVQSSDVQASNINVGQYATGVTATYGSGRWTNVHVWSCNTGVTGTGWDSSQATNVYLDSNHGWGMDLDRIDRAVFENIYAWNNGHTTGSTGGIRLRRTTGNGNFSSFKNVVLDDNVGWGAYIDGPNDYEFEAVLNSATVAGGGSVVTTTGVEVTSATTRLTLDIQGTGATTPLIDSSTTTFYGRWARNVHAAASKTTPVDADEIGLVDSAASSIPKRLTWANLKAAIASYYDSLASTMANKTLTTPVLNGTPTGTGVAAAATASALALRDSDANLTADNFIATRTSTATAAGTTTLTIADTQVQVFTGSTTQTVKLPTTGVTAGQTYTLINQSSGTVAVQSSSAASIVSLFALRPIMVVAKIDTPTVAADWDLVYLFSGSAAVSTAVVLRDGNANITADAYIATATSTATAAGTTTLTINSSQTQVFTGSTTQTVLLPTTSVVAGQMYTVCNNSTGSVTVQSSGANTVATVLTNTLQLFIAQVATPTTAAHWRAI